jgi:hypothetical protein
MTPTAFQVHKSWLLRAALVLVVTALADGLTAWFAPRPILWCVSIASTLPISILVFVAMPILLEEKRKS